MSIFVCMLCVSRVKCVMFVVFEVVMVINGIEYVVKLKCIFFVDYFVGINVNWFCRKCINFCW